MTPTKAGTTDTETVTSGHREFLFPCAPPYYEDPIVLVRGRGMDVVDADGRTYLDFFSGILTTGIGHCHPDVVDRVREQLGTLGHTSTMYLTEPQVEYARRLAAIAPGALQKSFFTNSGTEAVETAVMLACMYTGRSEIIALRLGYSGRSVLATNLTAHHAWRPLAAGIAGITHVQAPYPYRCPYTTPCDSTCVDKLGDDLEEAIVTTTNGKPAAFFAETVLGVGGFVVPPPGYFQRAAEIIRSYGGVFIADEVQAGFGRTGTHWFGIEHWGVEPDIMVMAKTIANGMPMGATIATAEIADAWTAKTISTFGGNPVTMAAALATNDVMVREDVPRRSAERGAQLRVGLDALARHHPWMGEVRGLGLMLAVEVVTDRESRKPSTDLAKRFHEAAKSEGLLVGIAGLYGQVVRVAPSMLITETQVADGLSRMGRAADAVSASQ
jgi:4-aminobutyrate aminotransferase